SLEGFDLDVMISEMQDFFHIVQETFPEDVLSDRYLYRHAGTLPGIALFAKRMKDIEGVSWRNTLRNALGSVPFSTDNVHFVRYGRASYNSEGKVQFTGSKGAISAVVKTLEQLAVWLDENGNEALWAYQTNRKEEMVKIISEEEAERKAEEVARMTEQESNTEYDTAPVDEDLSASERVVLSAIEKAENKSITG
ncbi:TPA: hypothetical protein POA52_004909, partial [Escherichia coli]|nr:hypothetical protein [Escherichia coli]